MGPLFFKIVALLATLLILLNKVVHSKRISTVGHKDKDIPSLPERMDRLDNLAKLYPGHPIPLSLKQYRQLVYPSPRSFSVFVLFVKGDDTDGMDEYCDKCGQAMNWWGHVAGIHFVQELAKTPQPQREAVYFAQVNIYWDNSHKVKVPVDMLLPNIFYFGNTTTTSMSKRSITNGERIVKLNISQFKNDEFPRKMCLLDLITWIQESSGVFIDLRTEPPKFAKSTTTAICGVVFTCCYFVWRFCNVTWLFEQIWGGIAKLNFKYWAVVIAIWYVSGQMFNQISRTGWAYYDDHHNVMYISRSQNYQMLTESFIVMAIYGSITFSLIQLIQAAEDAHERKTQLDCNVVMGYSTMFIASFLALMQLARVKH